MSGFENNENDGVKLALSAAEYTRTEDSNLSLSQGVQEMLHAAAYTAIEKPVVGVTQLFNHVAGQDLQAPEFIGKPEHQSAWTAAGNFAGTLTDFYFTSKLVGKGFQATGLRTGTKPIPVLEAGTAGALYELAMPVAEDNFAANKMRTVAVGFGTFAAMDGAASAMNKYGVFRPTSNARTLMGDVAVNGTAGVAGGITHNLLDSGLSGKSVNFYELGNDALYWGAFGAAFGGLDHGVFRGQRKAADYIARKEANGEALIAIGGFELHRGTSTDRMRTQVQELKAENVRLQDKVAVDDLTQLFNKGGGKKALEMETARAAREGEPLSAVVIDLDGFKAVNDTFGHNMGDQALQVVADIMRRRFSRGTDVLIRNGGDEFLVLLPNTGLSNAERLATQFQDEMRLAVGTDYVRVLQPGESVAAGERAVGASLGTVELKPGEGVVDFMHRGDGLAYTNKAQRKAAGIAKDRGIS